MNILHLWQSHYPWDVRVAKINRTLRDHGIQVTTLARARKGEKAIAEFEGTRIVRLMSPIHRALTLPIPFNPLWTRAIIREAKKRASDLILVRDIPLALSALKAARALKIPAVLDMAEHYPEAMRSWKKYSSNFVTKTLVHDLHVPDRIEKAVCDRFDAILVVCQEQKDRLVREYGIAESRIAVILNTPEIDSQPRSPAASRKRIAFGYHGILCEDRELETVLRGFDLAAEKNADITLLLAGGGESEESLRQLKASLKHGDRIEMTGRYEPGQLAELYERVDFGIVSLRKNTFTEHTLANKFFDYASLGKPFLYTALSPLERIMREMRSGVGFEAGDPASFSEAMLKIMALDYEEMRKNGQESVSQRFNWGVDSKRMLDVLRSLVKKKLAGAGTP